MRFLLMKVGWACRRGSSPPLKYSKESTKHTLPRGLRTYYYFYIQKRQINRMN